MTCVDIAVYAVPTERKAEFISHSEKKAPVFTKHGALAAVDCWGDDIPEGKVTSLPMAVKCEKNGTVCFSWITWPDKAKRDTGMAKAMEEMQSMSAASPMPFDGKRMNFGGFETIVEA